MFGTLKVRIEVAFIINFFYLQVEHNEVNYGLGLHHKSEGFGVYETFGEVLYDGASYTATCYIDLVQRRTQLDIHLDTLVLKLSNCNDYYIISWLFTESGSISDKY